MCVCVCVCAYVRACLCGCGGVGCVCGGDSLDGLNTCMLVWFGFIMWVGMKLYG